MTALPKELREIFDNRGEGDVAGHPGAEIINFELGDRCPSGKLGFQYIPTEDAVVIHFNTERGEKVSELLKFDYFMWALREIESYREIVRIKRDECRKK